MDAKRKRSSTLGNGTPRARSGAPTAPRWIHYWSTVVLATTSLGMLALLSVSLVRFSHSVSVPQLVAFYIMPAGIAACCTWLLFSTRAVRAQAALLITSMALALYMVEFVLQSQDVPKVAQEVARARGQAADPRSRTEFVRDRRQGGERIFPHLSAPQLLAREAVATAEGSILPLAPGVSRASIALCNEEGEFVVHRSDEYGFHNPLGLWGKATEVDVLLIGDSFVHGACAPAENTLAALLRRRWPSLLNLGVSGAGPLFELAVLREYGPEIQPPIVLWFYYEGNDPFDLSVERNDGRLLRYMEAGFSQDLRHHQSTLDNAMIGLLDSIIEGGSAPEALMGTAPKWSAVLSVATLSAFRSVTGLGLRLPTRADPIAMFPAVMAEAKKTVASWGGQLFVVYLPAYARYHLWFSHSLVGRSEVLGTLDSLAIPVIDLDSAFRAEDSPGSLWLHPAGHYSDRGNTLVSRVVLSEVTQDPSPPR